MVGALIALTAFGFYYTASANPLGFFRTSSVDGVATTSPAYMTPGTATTTKYFDTGSSNNFATDNAVFALQFTGSSTDSSVSVAFEYAAGVDGSNCKTTPTACDWYKDGTLDIAGFSTTSQASNVTVPNSFTMSFASTTQGGAVGSSTRALRLITAPTYTRYIRAVITMPAGSLNGAVWGEFIGKKQS